MNFSFWENKNWFSDIDFAIIGSGIVGLHTALRLRELYPISKIVIFEKGMLPQGASTKNAGFACFGSLSEILSDLENHSEQEVLNLVEKRWKGLQLLRKRLGDKAIDFKQNGSYELFFEKDTEMYEKCFDNLSKVNQMLSGYFDSEVFSIKPNIFGFEKCKEKMIFNPFEGQIDTGNMMQNLLKEVHKNNILILNKQKVLAFQDLGNRVELEFEAFTITSQKVFFATNGFASELTQNEVIPARAQVLITKPIENLHIKGIFHIDEGFYYFRNFENRILLGGARNIDFEGETTAEFELNNKIQNQLDEVLKNVILPNTDFEIEQRWCGIMGMGTSQKTPIVKQLSENVFCGVRLGGIGVAIGGLIGKELAELNKPLS